MKKISGILGGMLLVSALGAVSAMAAPITTNLTGLQTVINGITKLPVAGTSSVNVATDYLDATKDSTWSISGSGGSLATMIIELAGFADNNIFGVYDSKDASKRINLFEGAATKGAKVVLGIEDDGSVHKNFVDTGVKFAGNSFGYFLDSSYYAGGGIFYSNSSLNEYGADHLLAYQGTGDTVKIGTSSAGLWNANEYILAFEDLHSDAPSDWNFTDMVVMVESANPVPEPATMLLFGTGLVGLAGFGSRRRSRNNA